MVYCITNLWIRWAPRVCVEPEKAKAFEAHSEN